MQSILIRPRRVMSLLTLGFVTFISPLALAADEPPSEALLNRSAKIVAQLELDDTVQIERVTLIIARHYADLGPVHDARDVSVAAAKSAQDEEGINRARDLAAARQAELRAAFLGRLAAELSPAQIDAVKDGLTYGVLPNTFRVYQEMLPDLTPEQSRQLYAWLYEAREHAITAGSSDEKHGWFGKYKGKINNYLSKAGIDMKAAEKAMFDRRKQAP